MSSRAALDLADKAELDLVCISAKAQVPVVKITDYGKFKFEKKKKEQENKRNQQVIETKEVRLTVNIGKHDFDTKLKKAKEFLEDGQRLKVSLRFRGREMQNKKPGYETLNNFIDALADYSEIDRPPVLNRIFLDAYLKSTVKKQKPNNKPTNNSKPVNNVNQNNKPANNSKPVNNVNQNNKPTNNSKSINGNNNINKGIKKEDGK